MDALKLSNQEESVDKTALKELTAQANALNLTKYQEEGKAEFEIALRAALDGLEDTTLSQNAVDALYAELKTAMGNLKLNHESKSASADKYGAGDGPVTGDDSTPVMYVLLLIAAGYIVLVLAKAAKRKGK